MQIVFTSREQAERYQGTAPYAVISVIDPKQRREPLQKDTMRVGRLIRRCHDLGAYPEEPFWDKGVYFSEDDANAILDFVKRMREKTDRFLIHCEAGISRSCGVAVALGKIYGVHPVNPNGEGIPNQHIVRILLAQHQKRILLENN